MLGILLAACISKVFCRFVTAAELVVLLTLYVQGNFLVNHMPPFDGTEIVWEDYRGENIKTAIVCILIAAAVVTVAKLLGAKRFQGICMAVSAGLSGILMITLVTMTVTTGAYRERTTYYALENGQYRLSQDQNFLVLLLDAVDAKTFEEVMDSDPAYTETFADFTYYPDMVGAYPWTAFSVPYILSGKWYEGEEYYLDYAAAAVDESGLFRELSERDYDIALYESDLQAGRHPLRTVFPKGILLSGHCTDAGAAQCLCGREQSSVYLGSQRICHTYAGRRGDVSGGKVFPVLSFAGRACSFPV